MIALARWEWLTDDEGGGPRWELPGARESIDLRPISDCGTTGARAGDISGGWAIGRYASAPAVEHIPLGRNMAARATPSDWFDKLGIRPVTGSTVGQALAQTLIGGDPRQLTRTGPLSPERDSTIRFKFGGVEFKRRMRQLSSPERAVIVERAKLDMAQLKQESRDGLHNKDPEFFRTHLAERARATATTYDKLVDDPNDTPTRPGTAFTETWPTNDGATIDQGTNDNEDLQWDVTSGGGTGNIWSSSRTQYPGGPSGAPYSIQVVGTLGVWNWCRADHSLGSSDMVMTAEALYGWQIGNMKWSRSGPTIRHSASAETSYFISTRVGPTDTGSNFFIQKVITGTKTTIKAHTSGTYGSQHPFDYLARCAGSTISGRTTEGVTVIDWNIVDTAITSGAKFGAYMYRNAGDTNWQWLGTLVADDELNGGPFPHHIRRSNRLSGGFAA